MPSPSDSKPYLTVNLRGTYVVTGIDIQGAMEYFTSAFHVVYSIDGLSWQSVDDQWGLPAVFTATGGQNITHVEFDHPFRVCAHN
jgi:hypothetical protein